MSLWFFFNGNYPEVSNLGFFMGTLNLYAFFAQIMPFRESDFEKFYAYGKLLQTKLPKADISETNKEIKIPSGQQLINVDGMEINGQLIIEGSLVIWVKIIQF